MVGYGSNRLIRVSHLVGDTLPKKMGLVIFLRTVLLGLTSLTLFFYCVSCGILLGYPLKKIKLNCAIYRKWIVLYAFDCWTGLVYMNGNFSMKRSPVSVILSQEWIRCIINYDILPMRFGLNGISSSHKIEWMEGEPDSKLIDSVHNLPMKTLWYLVFFLILGEIRILWFRAWHIAYIKVSKAFIVSFTY